MAAGAPDPLAIAGQFMGALAAHFGKADLASVGAMYGADSIVAIDGTPADGPAAIAEFYKMRVSLACDRCAEAEMLVFSRRHAASFCATLLVAQFAGGPVGMKIISTDAQFTPDAANPKLLVLVTGDTGSAGKAPVS